MLINYDTAILMARRLPCAVIAWEVNVYKTAWEIIKNSGCDLHTISVDLQRDLTDGEVDYLKT